MRGAGTGMTTGVVLVREGGVYRVHTEGGEVTATLRGKLKHRDDDRVVPGDVVELDVEAEGTSATITGIRPRRSVLARRAAQGGTGGGARRSQPVAANVDPMVVVAAAGDPEPSPRKVDRFLLISEANGPPAVLVGNEVELGCHAAPALAP